MPEGDATPERGIRRGIRRLFRLAVRSPRTARADIDDEIDFHLRERTDDLVALGFQADMAALEARRRFGNPIVARDHLLQLAQQRENAMRVRERLDTLVADGRLALRGFRRTPMFVLVAVTILALGIGANTTVFSWMEALVLDPLPAVKDVKGLVTLSTGTPSGATQPISYPDYLDWSAATHTLSAVVAYRREHLSLRTTAGADAQAIWGVFASSNYFAALGVTPILGRAFSSDESAPRAAAGSAPVTVIGYDLWQRALAGDTAVLGRAIWLDGHEFTVIGVAPPGFHGTNVGFAFDIWMPITMQPTLLGQPAEKLLARRSRWLTAFARVAPHTTAAQAARELAAIGTRVAAVHPEDKGTTALVRPLLDAEASGSLKPVFLVLLGATGAVLLIVCFNLAGLQLVRASARSQELSVRIALGASRGRVIQQFLVESALLAVAALPLTIAVAFWSRGVLAHFAMHSTFPLAVMPGVHPLALAFTALLASIVMLAIAVWPALRACAEAAPALRIGSTRTTTGRGRLRETLVVAQLALSIICVTAAGLLVHSLQRLRTTDTGLIDPAHVLVATTDFDLAGPGYAGYGDNIAVRARRLPVAAEILQRMRNLPGVRDATLMDTPPLGLISGFDSFDTDVPGYVRKPNEDTAIEISYVTPGFFTTVGPAIERGRGFTAVDRAGADGATVVNDAFARHFFSGDDPASSALGKTVIAGGRNLTVVGVVRDAKYHLLSEPRQPFLYLSYEQWSPSALAVAVRTEGDPIALAEPLRKVFHDVDPALPFLQPLLLIEQVDGALTLPRFAAALLSALGVLAVAIAGLGLYGALAQTVQQRHREIGIRMALGARKADVVRQFARRGLAIAVAALVLGSPGVFVVGRVLRGQIYGVGPLDPVALASATAVVLAIAVTASLITAIRAGRVAPATSIRND